MPHPGLSNALVELSGSLVSDLDLVLFLRDLTAHAAAVTGVDAVGVVLGDRDVPRFLSASDHAGEALELFQIQSQEGPCVDCLRSARPVVVSDLTAAGDRWPTFGPRAVAAGFRSVHAVPMRVRDRAIGALNLFSRDRVDLADDDVRALQALADLASIAVAQQQWLTRTEDLVAAVQIALTEQIVVEQAKGAVAQRDGTDVDTAFATLRERARDTGQRVVDAAREVLDAT